MKRRILSIITALALCLSLCPTWAFAVEGEPDTGLCDHHPEHIGCGYAAPTEGHDCGHEHTEDCYTTDEAGSKVLDCQHSHDSECGYVQADPGTPCGYVCRVCPIEDLIAALPEQVTEDNADDMRARLDEILDLYRELDENEQGQIDLSRVTALQEALDAANAPVAAAETITVTGNTDVTLIAEDGGCQGHTFTGTAQAARIYVESGAHNVTFSGLNITKSAMVGVVPGATMNLTIEGTNTIKSDYNAGIYVPENATLVITAESTGTLDVSSSTDAGIGGGAFDPSDPTGYTSGDPNCGTVVINGGTVTATGGSVCAGIGGGTGADYSPGNGGTVTISGGTVTAAGGVDRSGNCGGAGIGGSAGETDGSRAGSGGSLTISGGHVTLTAGNSTSYGFGQGTGKAPGGTCELTLTDASYLAEGTTLDPNGKYTITGDPTPDMIVVPEDLIYSGKAQELAGRIYIDDSKTGTGTYFGQTFTVNASADGWVLQDLGEVVEAKEYTATFTKGDQSISKKFTVAKSGTDLTEGKVLTYNGDTPTKDFTVGDTITVKATPTATGAAPQKAAARLRGEPGTGQMALYVGDALVSSEAADADAAGTYTMTVSAADVLLAAGGPGTEIPLTARFTANDNMADGTGTATVNISAVARVEKDSTTTYVGALANAFTEGNSGATVTLLSEVDLSRHILISSSTFTLNLNGQTVKASHYGAFQISGGSLTIQDSGTSGKIESSNITIEVTGGTLSIKSGTVSGFYGVQITSGTVNISGGVISGTENGLWVNGGGNIVLSGGAYSGRHAIWVDANVSVTLKDLLASECAYHSGDAPIPLQPNGKELTGTVTVKECNHTGGLVPSENGYQHGGPCKCCGSPLDTANHTLGAENKCSGCGAALAAKVEKSGSDTVYVEASNLASAFAAENTGATVTLLKDVDLGENDLMLRSGTFTLDCGAFTLSSSSEYFVIKLDNADLTFAGGTIQCNGTGTPCSAQQALLP